MHHRESHLTSNTGRLAKNTLPDCQIYLRGLKNTPLPWETILNENEKTFLLYPSQDATEVTSSFFQQFSQPVHIIVPDGSWRQASKVYKRESEVKNIPRIKIPLSQNQSRYLLRKAPHPGHLCTYEAMAKIVGLADSKREESKMDENLKVLVRTCLEKRRHFDLTRLELSL